MDDTELDELLQHTRPEAPGGEGIREAVTGLIVESRAAAATTAVVTAVATGPTTAAAFRQSAHRPHRPRRPRKPLLVATVAAGIVVLTAGAGVTAAQLGIPPFQGLEPGVDRLVTAAPIDYVETDGTPVACKAFLEFRNLDSADRARLEAAVAAHDWSRVGQFAYDSAHADATTPEARSSDFGDAIAAALYAEAKQVVPQLERTADFPQSRGLLYNGYGMSCTAQNTW